MNSIDEKRTVPGDRLRRLEKALRERPLVFTLIMAAFVVWGLSIDGVISEQALPFGDGEHYALRAMTLYGFLHSGQWSRFWDVFTFPKQSLAPLHYWLFFLLPRAWAGMTAYGVVQGVTTYLLLALGIWTLCREMDRPAWTPALFLLCAVQNTSIDDSYFYFADMPFMAMAIMALAWQVRAWRKGDWQSSVASGVGLGLLFWVKAPNAIIFTVTYLIAEIVYAVIAWRESKSEYPWRDRIARHLAAVVLGSVPIILAALVCGGFQSIIRQIEQNEVSDIFATTLHGPGLLRLFYFPLCLTFFYHAGMMTLVLAVMGIAAWKMNRGPIMAGASPFPQTPFPASRLLPLMAAYVVLGEFFSFGEECKGMRSLLVLLPVMWLAVFWVLEKWRVRPGLVFLAALAYGGIAFSQILFNTFGTMDVPTEGYQLEGDWLGRLPQDHGNAPQNVGLTDSLLDMLRHALPDGGKVAIGSEQIHVTSESLAWDLQHNLALRGEPAPFIFENFLQVDGKCCRSALVNARAVIFYVHPALQYSRAVYDESGNLLRYIAATWPGEKLAQILPLKTEDDQILGALVITAAPLTDAQVTRLIEATNSVELPPDSQFNPPVEKRLTWAEYSDILQRWKNKRLGN